jgi:AGZA family xanthine/uracil permease-like MFS transporter
MSYPLFVKKDIDGFFGLAIDNLVQLILIVSFCKMLCGMPDELVFGMILPGAAISILWETFSIRGKPEGLRSKQKGMT